MRTGSASMRARLQQFVAAANAAAAPEQAVEVARAPTSTEAPAAHEPVPDLEDGLDAGMAASLAALDDVLREIERDKNTGTAAVQATVAPTAVASAAPATSNSTPFKSIQQAIDFVNKTYFVAPLSGEAAIWREGIDHDTGARVAVPVSMGSVRIELAPLTVNVATAQGTKTMPVFDVWLRSPRRREYPGGVILQPEGTTPAGCFNLWQGFGLTPRAGDASPLVDHVAMLCGGPGTLTDYVLDWLALCVQRPGTRPEVAMVLRGGRGTGKGTLFRVMQMIFGAHALHITQSKHLVGNFNSHLRTALWVFADEAHWPGDRAAEGVLKGLITEPTLAIEMKGHDVYSAPNRIKLAMASNNDWIVPAGADERRYCVIDVSSDKAQDHGYFGTLNAWIDNGGAEIFLAHLLSRDLSAFNVRAVPKTAALDRQKIEGMSALDRWILDALDSGEGLSDGEWTDAPQRAVCTVALSRFETYAKRSPGRGAQVDSRAIGKRLHEIFGCGPAAVALTRGHQRARAWALPGLTEARESAASAFGLAQYEWGAA